MKQDRSKTYWGILFLVLAAFLFLDGTGILPPTLDAFSIAFLGIGTILALHSLYEISFLGFYTGIAIAYFELSKMLDIPHVSISLLALTVILLTIGTSLLVPSNYINKTKEKRMQKYKIYDQNWESRADAYEDPNLVGKYQTVENRDNENYAYGKNSFGATSKYITMDNLQGATLECSFGELKAYFDGSTIVNPPIDITLHCNFGTIELYLPKEWNINPMVKVSLGNIEEKNHPVCSNGPVVNLMGSVSFGSVQIIYV